MQSTSNSVLREEWAALAPAWIEETRVGRNASRNGLLDKPMIDACGDVRGLRVLDCGCGEGRFCRILLELGAESAVGLDLCEPMIAAAADLASGKDEYRVADVQDMPFLGDASFDLAVSYLNQCDLPDFEANNREVLRVLKPGGRFVVATVHPMRSATGQWCRSEHGVKQHVNLDNYFDESERCLKTKMLVKLTNFHRTLSTHVQAYLSAGFRIDGIVEPTVDAESLACYPELDDETRVPNFIVFVLGKPGER